MLPSLNLPASLLDLLYELRPCFTAPGFATFCGLVAGLAGQVRRRTVVGMLLGACLQHAWPHDRAHYFFARARWELDHAPTAGRRARHDLGNGAINRPRVPRGHQLLEQLERTGHHARLDDLRYRFARREIRARHHRRPSHRHE